MNTRQRLVLVALIPLVVVGGLLIGSALRPERSSSGVQIASATDAVSFEHDYVIPLGTGNQIDAGETVEIVPLELVVHVGDAIRIVNDDDRDHVVGVFFVGSGETLTQRFTTPGVLEGQCSVHSGGEFTLRVEA